MIKNKISVCIVLRNEGKLIRRCLDSVMPIANEILIGHDGECLDDTLIIAKEYTDKIFVFPRAYGSEPHRPKLYELAANEWILQLDGDEYLTQELQNFLINSVLDTNVSLYEIKWMDEFDGKRVFTIYKQILFQKSKVYFIGAFNEYAKTHPGGLIRRIDQPFINAPINNVYKSFQVFLKKYSKIAKTQAIQYSEPFQSINKWNYTGSDWEPPTKLKIQHPIILGVLALPTKFVFNFIIGSLARKNRNISFPGLIYMIIFFWMLYSKLYVIKIKKDWRNIIYI